MSSSSLYRADSNSASVNWVGKAPAPRKPVAAIADGSSGASSSPAKLPVDEPVVRHVAVERLDQEVAVMIGVRPVVVMLVAVRLGEPGHVHPVPRIALAMMRARPGGDRRVVRRRRGHGSATNASICIGGGGQPGQVETDATDQGTAIGRRIRVLTRDARVRRG